MSTGTPTTITQTSTITESLVELLRQRSQVGQAKYGVTLDRTDLSVHQWITHTVEELLDGAGYLLCVGRELDALSTEVGALETENQRLRADNERMSAALRPLLELAQTLGLSAPVAVQEAPVAVPQEVVLNILTPDKMLSSEPAKETTEVFAGEEQPAYETPENVTCDVTSDPDALPIGLPRGMLTSTQFAELVGVAASTLSGYVKGGLVAPAGWHLSRGMKAAHYQRCQVKPLLEALRAKAQTRPAPPAGVAYTKAETEEGILTSKEAAALLGVTPGALAKALTDGKLTAHSRGGSGKLTLFTRAEIERYKQAKEENLRAAAAKLVEHNQRVREEKSSAEAPEPTPVSVEPTEPTETAFDRSARARALAAQTRQTPTPTIDTNESGKLAMIEEGKQIFRDAKSFVIARLTSGKKWLWDYLPDGANLQPDWEIVEVWKRNGLGRWESTPADPGAVGMGNGITRGPVHAGVV